ncbi:MAG: Ribulose-phosphate 3-epimerase [Acidimicrobiaceae bacterium]|nr:Ribulose-phosphate 3-epimerase [Acidimicrobiaceae bacterium]
MLAYVSLWSADLLALGEAVDMLAPHVAGFHIDVFDGHNVPELLFGPDLVAALSRRTSAMIDVHLNCAEPDYWVDRFADSGAGMLTVQSSPCADVASTLEHIAARGVEPSLGLELSEPVELAVEHFGLVRRVLVLGTEIGVKGRGLDPSVPERVRALVAARRDARPLVVVDGGIRRHTVPLLAEAGADGVVPGSLVFSGDDPLGNLSAVNDLGPGCRAADAPAFWRESSTINN